MLNSIRNLFVHRFFSTSKNERPSQKTNVKTNGAAVKILQSQPEIKKPEEIGLNWGKIVPMIDVSPSNTGKDLRTYVVRDIEGKV